MTETGGRAPPFGGPQRGPVLMWSERGARTGGDALPPPNLAQRALFQLYAAIWAMLGLLAWPVLALHPRARRHLWRLPAPEPGWLWLHGASAGEHVAARALAECLPAEVWRTSSSWRTPVPDAFPAPLDLPFVIGPWLDRARPRLLVLVESELWPGWLLACRRRGVPVVVVNARDSRGTARLRRWPSLWRWMTEGVRFIGQDQTGDLKLSTRLRAATWQLGRDTFVAASTRPGDDEKLVAAWRLLAEPRPLLVLAPRHADRVPEVIRVLEREGLPFARRSALASQERAGGSGDIPPDTSIFVLDTQGELASLYPQARAAFVGGTFDPSIGGHSPAEAFVAGLPVVHGPHTGANPAAWNQGFALKVGDGPELAPRLAKAMHSALRLGPRPAPHNEAAVRAATLLPQGHTPPETPLHPALSPLSPLWAAALQAAPSWRGPPQRVGVPVVSVGALVAGGAGKTPVVGWLAGQLDGAFVLARGFGRQRGTEVRLGRPGHDSDARWLGDELEMLRRRQHPVVSAPDRVEGARLAEHEGARLVLLDDGFQHRRLHRDLDIVCVDARWPDGRGPIPVGWRREPWSALERAHVLWVNHGELPAEIERQLPPHLTRVSARARPAAWLRGGRLGVEILPINARTGAVDVVVGIARPEPFVCALLRLGLTIRSLRLLPDHAPLTDVPPGAVMTEKDAARLPPEADVWALRQELDVEGGEALLARIRALKARP